MAKPARGGADSLPTGLGHTGQGGEARPASSGDPANPPTHPTSRKPNPPPAGGHGPNK